MQRVNARAAVRIRVRVKVCAARAVGLAMPRIAVALGHRLGIVRAVVDCQVKGHYTVRAVDVQKVPLIRTTGRERLSIPRE